MDKIIGAETRRKTRTRVFTIMVISAVIIISLIWLLRTTLSPSIKRSDISIAVVETGSIENTLSASGEILPEFEEVITSPINASIKNVNLNAGSTVKAGQSILSLDKDATMSELQKMRFQLEGKRNNIRKLKLELNKSFFDLKSNNEIKQLRINNLRAEVENAKRLYKAGGATRESVEQAELNLQVALLEKKQLENEIKSKQQTMQVEIRESEITAAIQENDLKDLTHKLQQADITANRGGVITWINGNIGSSIREGESLARISNLSSYKVSGKISDAYIDNLTPGLETIVRVNETDIRGRLINIHPAVQNGIVSFDVELEDKSNKLLRPNMKVDVFLVTSKQNKVMRVANGPAFKGGSPQDVFVVSNDKAVRRKVNTGMSNFDYVELKDNVRPGDKIITSDMSDFKNANEIKITDLP